MPTRVLQLTDLHLFADPAERLKGIPTRETLADVLALVRRQFDPFERLLITGDLAHDERAETYRALRDVLGDWLPRCRLIPGNHDNRPALRDVFPEIVPAGGDWLTFADVLDEWRLIGLDSHVPGEVAGHVSPDQLEWLRDALHAAAGHPTVVFIHHPPFSVGSRWLDRIGLRDPEPLRQVLHACSHVEAVCSGHVHHAFVGRWGAVQAFASPSTCVQFDPSGDEPSYTAGPPGFRVFDFGRHGFCTEVIHLPAAKYRPVDERET